MTRERRGTGQHIDPASYADPARTPTRQHVNPASVLIRSALRLVGLGCRPHVP